MKLKIILAGIISLVFCAGIFSQPRKENFKQNILFSQVYIIPSVFSPAKKDSAELLYYIYKIPYNRLVFEKNDSRYTASYRLTVEVHDTTANTISRKIKEGKISVNDFEQTDEEDIYAEGALEFKIEKNKKYILIPVFFDVNSGREIKLEGVSIHTRKKRNENSSFLEPLAVKSPSAEKTAKSVFILANFEGCIPFSKEKFDLLIPCIDTSIQKVFISIVSNKDTVLSNTFDGSVIIRNSIEESNGEVVLTNNDSLRIYRDFFIPFINKDLAEGEFTIKISTDKESEQAVFFHKEVIWFNKPVSLTNPELAIKFLKYLETDTVIDSLLDFNSDNYSNVLFNYWKRFDPTPGTAYNELMNEYYSRIDYSMRNFSSITGKRGFDTDRGKIFILYGKPSETERTSNQLGKVVETWVYKNPYRKFIFVDETGTGEYKLKNS